MRHLPALPLILALCSLLFAGGSPAAAATRTFGARISTGPPDRFCGTLLLPKEVELEETTLTVTVNRGRDRLGACAKIGPTKNDPTTGGNTAPISGRIFLLPGAPELPREGPFDVTVTVGIRIATMTLGALVWTTAPSGKEPARISGELILPDGWVISSSLTDPDVDIQAVVTRGDSSLGAAITLEPAAPDGRIRFSGRLYGADVPTAGPLGATLTLFLPVDASP